MPITYIKAGPGFNVGQDFARVPKETPMTVERRQGQYVYGTIAGNAASSLGFMRAPRVHVCVRQDLTRCDTEVSEG